MSVRQQAIARQDAEIEASAARAIAAREGTSPRRMTALESLAARLEVSTSSLQETLLNTAFKGCGKAEFIALVIVANTYNLNPLLREIYAFPKKGGGIQPMVGYDGWIKIANTHPQYDGFETDHIEDTNGNLKAIEGILYRKDRSRPTKKIVYLKEFKRNTDPWNNSPHHMLDVRCFCQTVRLALGIPLGVEGIDDVNGIDGQFGDRSTVLPGNDQFSTGALIEHDDVDAETGEVLQRDARGMTEVDESTARELDARQGNDGTLSDDNPTAAEGPSDEDRGEAHTDDAPMWLGQVRDLRAKLAAAKTSRAVAGIERDWLNTIRNGVPDEGVVRSVEGDIAARKRDLADGGEG